MPEGLMVAGSTTVAAAVHDDPDHAPPPGPDAPKGWAWNRKSRSWQPRVRGKVLWEGVGSETAGEPGTGPVNVEPGDQQERDPDPGWMAQEQPERPAAGRVKFSEVPQAVKDDIAGLAGLVATPILAMVRSVDPYCGGALTQSFEGALDATLPLICRSEKIVRYFSEDKADWLAWGKVALALAPVGQAIFEHHIARTVHLVKDPDTGSVQVVRGQPQPGSDPLQPPQAPAFSYAA